MVLFGVCGTFFYVKAAAGIPRQEDPGMDMRVFERYIGPDQQSRREAPANTSALQTTPFIFPPKHIDFCFPPHRKQESDMRTFRSIDEYTGNYPPSTRRMLDQMRRTIHVSAPAAEGAICYGLPTFKLKGNLVHFAGYRNHIGFHPGSAAITAFKKQLSAYKTSKGTVQFSLDKSLPLALVRKIVRFRVAATIPPDPFERLAVPARRALSRAGVISVKQLSNVTERYVAGLHGLGPNAMRTLRAMLRANDLRFRPDVKKRASAGRP